MADALVSPLVGGAMWAVAAGLTAYSAKKVEREMDDRKVPLMGVLGAFVFAAQMINFSIPGTGSSGHLGGGLLLSILIGPYAGLLTMASILTIQALFFADGGLLALGCNIFNLGFFPCFIAYLWVYRPLVNTKITPVRVIIAATLAGVLGLQLGAFSVVMQTLFSGLTALPFRTFLLFMQPIHFVIGLIEGLVTAAVILFINQARPEILENGAAQRISGVNIKSVLIALGISALLTAGVLSWFASSNPDGLEWSIFHVSGREAPNLPRGIHRHLERFQEKLGVLPDYDLKRSEESRHPAGTSRNQGTVIQGGRSIAGLIGGAMTLFLTGIIGFVLRWLKRRRTQNNGGTM